MASRTRNIVIDRGSDFSANTVAYVNTSSSSVVDLSSYTANAGIRKSHLHTANVAAIFNVWIANTTLGIVKIDLNSANTVLMKDGKYVYDIMVSSAGGVKTRIVEGIATVTPGVAR